MRSLDHKGRYTLKGVYDECSEVMDGRLRKVNYGKGKHIKHINYKTFTTIVCTYFKILLSDLVKGGRETLYNRFGEIYPVKTKAVRYNPKTYVFKKVDGKVVREEKKVNLGLTNGYVYFVFWNAPKIYRHYKLKLSRTWNKRLINNVLNEGLEVLDITLKSYGRNASPTYIQKIK